MKRPRVDVNLGELDQLLDHSMEAPLSETEAGKIKTALHALAEVLEARRNSASSEKTRAVLGAVQAAVDRDKPAAPGHGRIPAMAYEGAKKVAVPHPELAHGTRCPNCQSGNVYTQQQPRPLVRITG